ncbi:MAG: Hsp70 family protein [Clostridiales bacterium]|nr:Hsp70 family protein [Clostridiales bacterium]
MSNGLGCDIGNGYGYVSILEDPGGDAMPLLPDGLAESGGMPTTAYVTPPYANPIVVYERGRPAEDLYQRDPQRLVSAVKTRLREKNIRLPGVEAEVSAAKIYAAIVRTLVSLSDEERRLQHQEPVRDIVLTFPAAFSDDALVLEEMQRSVEAEAVNGQKIHVVGRLPEPAAVAIDYLYYMQHIAPEDVRITQDHFTVLVYDLGHGTFDTAVVTARSKGEPFQLYRKDGLQDGLQDVGGRDFDKLIYDYILNELKEKYGYIPGNEQARERIRKEAVKVKHELTESDTSEAGIQIGDDVEYVKLTREQFERMGADLINQTLELVYSVLEDAEDRGISIDGIVLSGGASKMPMVREGLEKLFGDKYPITLYRPETAVSFGAARYAASLPGNATDGPVQPTAPILEQLTDCCYGIWQEAEDGRLEGEVRFVVQSGQKRPVTSEPVLIRSERARLSVQLYRSRVKNKKLAAAPTGECANILDIPFDVTRGRDYQVQITVEEDYRVCVELRDTKTGAVQRKSTTDLLETLLR